MTELTYYFDLMCPWAYHTSKWVREARRRRDIDVTWRFFSLEESNREDGKRHPWERPWSYGWSLLRIAALLRRDHGGNDAVDHFYATAGRMLHEEGVPVHTTAGAAQAIGASGWDPLLVDDAIADESTNDDVRSEHALATARGVHGVPTLLVDRTDLLFGPVVAPAPTGDDAARLWDLVVAWTEFPHLYELQRPKLDADWKSIGSVFEPYRIARGWP